MIKPKQPTTSPQPKENLVDESLLESFPASDPPSAFSHDEPPANAQDKWDAVNPEAKQRGLKRPS